MSTRRPISRLPWRIAIVIVLAAGLGAYGIGTVLAAPDNTVYACVLSNISQQNVRIVNKNTNCTANEHAVSWNVTGPTGATGAVGATGAAGVTGAVGATGPVAPAIFATKSFDSQNVHMDAASQAEVPFGRTINLTSLFLNNGGNSDTMGIVIHTLNGDVYIHFGDGEYTHDFTLPVPATGVLLTCGNAIESCDANLVALGN